MPTNRALPRIAASARRHPRRALALYEKFEQAAIDAGEYALYLDTLYQRYVVLERLGEAHTLTDQIYQGVQLAEYYSLPHNAAQMLQALGRIRFTQASYRDAVRYWTKCMALCRISNDVFSLVEATLGMGQVCDALQDWERAIAYHREAGEILQNTRIPYLECKQAINHAVCLRQTGRYDEAAHLLQHALELAQTSDIREYVAEAHLHLGRLALLQGQPGRAEQAMRRALELARASSFAWLQGSATLSLADMLAGQGKTAEALSTYADALAQAIALSAYHHQAHCYASLSRLHEQNGDLAMSLHYARLHQAELARIEERRIESELKKLRSYELLQKSPVELLLDLSSNRVLDAGDTRKALNLICQSALGILHVEFVCVWLLNAAGDKLVCHALEAPAAFPLRLHHCLDRDDMPLYFRTMLLSKHALTAHDIKRHPAAAELATLTGADGLSALLEIPLRMHGQYAGTICFGQAAKKRNWSREDVLFGSHIGNLVQQVLAHKEHLRRQRDLEQRVAQRTTELQQQAEHLRQAQRSIFTLSEIGREITSSLDRNTITDIVYRHVHELMGAEVFALGLYRPELDLIEFPCNILRGARMLPYTRPADDRDLLSVWCIEHRQEIYINDIYSEYNRYIGADGLHKLTVASAYPSGTEKFVPVSHIYAPLIVKNKIVGLIVIQSTQKNAFARMHLDMALTLAAYTAVAIDNANSYEQLANAQELLVSREKLATLGSLVAGVAHEINTPIGNSLLTATTLLEQTAAFRQKVADNQLRRSDLSTYADLVGEANDLLIRNLMNASELISSFKQVSADQASGQKRLFNLAQTAHEVARTLQSKLRKHGHTLDIAIPPDIELNSFPGPFGQILTNFINNAVLHAFEGREHGSMRLSAARLPHDLVQVVFEDDGAGISVENLKKIFDPFFTTKLGHGGSGLGLSIVHNLVSSVMGGTIEVYSQLGAGTKITLKLPQQR